MAEWGGGSIALCFRSQDDHPDKKCELYLRHSGPCGPRPPMKILPLEAFRVEPFSPQDAIEAAKEYYNPVLLEGVIVRYDPETCECSRTWYRPNTTCFCECHKGSARVDHDGCGTPSKTTDNYAPRWPWEETGT